MISLLILILSIITAVLLLLFGNHVAKASQTAHQCYEYCTRAWTLHPPCVGLIIVLDASKHWYSSWCLTGQFNRTKIAR